DPRPIRILGLAQLVTQFGEFRDVCFGGFRMTFPGATTIKSTLSPRAWHGAASGGANGGRDGSLTGDGANLEGVVGHEPMRRRSHHRTLPYKARGYRRACSFSIRGFSAMCRNMRSARFSSLPAGNSVIDG